MSESYFLPYATSQVLLKSIDRCKNLGLILDKYPPQAAVQKSEGKGSWLRVITADSPIDTRLAASVYQRWRHMTEAVGARLFSAVTQWRMVVGLGGETVLETDLTLHHLYGIPYIPGSALKGLARGYVAAEVFPSEKIDDDHEIVKRIFGAQEQAGTVIFFDALPKDGRATFALDIMNAHYPNYYGEKKPPTNDQNPNPVTFLTVTDTTFTFALAPRHPGDERDRQDVELAAGWLQMALEKYGVGGKTSAGYGYLRTVRAEAEQEMPLTVASSQEAWTPASLPPSGQAAKATEHVRPPLPRFREGQEITGAVVPPSDDLRHRAPTDAQAFLRYQSFALKQVFMVVSAEEAQNWFRRPLTTASSG
jgi:CRISPR type III-B/RAMP module RAMP protein Cmr6